MSRLWYRQPASVWEEALPLGNGRLGAMVFGNLEGERVQVNEESVWYGGKKDRINPDAKEQLPVIRKLIREGRIREAQELCGTALTGCPNSENPYQTLGDIRIYFKHTGVKVDATVSPELASVSVDKEKLNYERSLDLAEAVNRVKYTVGGVEYKREYFISKPADLMVMRFAASEKGKTSFTLRLDRWYFFKGVKKTFGENGEANGVLMYGRAGEDGTGFVMMAKCAVKGGSRKVMGESLIVENADEAILYFGALTDYREVGADYAALEEKLCCHLEEAMKRDYQGILQEHIEDHSSLFDRVRLMLCPEKKPKSNYKLISCSGFATSGSGAAADMENVGEKAVAAEIIPDGKQAVAGEIIPFPAGCAEGDGASKTSGKEGKNPFAAGAVWESDEMDGIPTDERLKAVSEGKMDLGLQVLLFDYGRYLMIAGSRKGTLPTTLQGLWNQDFMPPWGAKYTININTEMNYWPAEVCNLSECHLPLFELLKIMLKDGRKTAREMYGCRGFVAHHNTDMHGDCAPQDLWFPATYWPMGAAWLCTHLWTHYCYTKDLQFLKEAFPIMAESALFFVDDLEPWGEYLVTNPSSSPENTYILPSGEKGCICLGPTMDNQILRDLFTICIDSYEILGEEADKAQIPDLDSIPELMKEIREKLAKIAPTKIGSDGRIMEWLEEYEEEEPGHRHVSQLYGLFPSEQITMDGTPELAAAARKTLEMRLSHGGGHTGWSRAWIMNHYAKLWDGDTAYENIEKMLVNSTYPNLFDKHPPFQIDGNFGASAAIANMLVQSSDKRVVVLPALPKAWNTGKVRGLRLYGNAQIDLAWENGELTFLRIHADSDYETLVKWGEITRQVKLAAGEETRLV